MAATWSNLAVTWSATWSNVAMIHANVAATCLGGGTGATPLRRAHAPNVPLTCPYHAQNPHVGDPRLGLTWP